MDITVYHNFYLCEWQSNKSVPDGNTKVAAATVKKVLDSHGLRMFQPTFPPPKYVQQALDELRAAVEQWSNDTQWKEQLRKYNLPM